MNVGKRRVVLGYYPILAKRSECFSTMAPVPLGPGLKCIPLPLQQDFMGNKDIRPHTVSL